MTGAREKPVLRQGECVYVGGKVSKIAQVTEIFHLRAASGDASKLVLSCN